MLNANMMKQGLKIAENHMKQLEYIRSERNSIVSSNTVFNVKVKKCYTLILLKL